MSLSAKTILITGASRGIGLEMVKQILRLGTAPEILIAACRNPSSCQDLQSLAQDNPSLKLVKLDVEKDDEIAAAVEEAKVLVGDRGLNLLINNAGLNVKNGSDLRHTTRDSLQTHFNVNFSSPVMMAQKFLPLLEQAAQANRAAPLSCSRAAVVNISSIMASQALSLANGHGTSYQYKCSKSAVTMASILMSRELQPAGIMVLSLHPGWVQTDMGGSTATLTPAQSVAGCLQVFATQSEENNGKLLDYKGDVLPF